MPENFKYSSLFGELTKNVQLRFDAISKQHKLLFDNVLYEKYLTWDFPSIGLTFEELLGKYNVTVAAATIDYKSKEPVLGSHGVETIQQKILNHAITLPMTIEDYRKVLQIYDSKSLPDEAAKRQLVELMWGNVLTPVKGVQAKIDILFLEALSNEGVVILNDNNNPEGGVKTTIDYSMPASNRAAVTVDWIPANQATADVFGDIQAIVNAAADKVVFEKILLSPAKLSFILGSPRLKQVIFGVDKRDSPLLIQQLNEFMRMNELPYFETIRRECLIQNDGAFKPYNPWNGKNIVFVPAGNLGVIKNAYSNNELRQEPGVAYSNYGRIRVSQWGVGETQNSNGVEFVKAESMSLPILTEINGIYSLKTEA